ncbi:MAG: CHAD domain-containing protein [Nocardioidaceae bacterium]
MTVVADGRVAAYWARQVVAFHEGVARIRSGDLTAVHPTRVAVRRMRSTLRSFDALFEARPVERLDHELEWVAEELGEVRDREVLLALFGGRVDLDPPLREPLLATLRREHAEHGKRLARVLAADRVQALGGRLDATVDEPGSVGEADLEPYRARARRILAKRLCRAGAEDEPERSHSARKAAKRVRYAAEVLGDDPLAVAEVRRAEALQDALGACQDLVVARDYLLDAAAEDPTLPSRAVAQLARALTEERLTALALVDRSGLCDQVPVVAASA